MFPISEKYLQLFFRRAFSIAYDRIRKFAYTYTMITKI